MLALTHSCKVMKKEGQVHTPGRTLQASYIPSRCGVSQAHLRAHSRTRACKCRGTRPHMHACTDAHTHPQRQPTHRRTQLQGALLRLVQQQRHAAHEVAHQDVVAPALHCTRMCLPLQCHLAHGMCLPLQCHIAHRMCLPLQCHIAHRMCLPLQCHTAHGVAHQDIGYLIQ